VSSSTLDALARTASRSAAHRSYTSLTASPNGDGGARAGVIVWRARGRTRRRDAEMSTKKVRERARRAPRSTRRDARARAATRRRARDR
jgi:hypothetical protein